MPFSGKDIPSRDDIIRSFPIQQLIDQAAFAFSGASGTALAGEELFRRGGFQFFVFLGRREILVVVGHELRADPGWRSGDESHATGDDALSHADDFIGMQDAGRFDRLLIHANRFGATRRGGECAGFKQPHTPQPFIDAGVFRFQRQGRECKTPAAWRKSVFGKD